MGARERSRWVAPTQTQVCGSAAAAVRVFEEQRQRYGSQGRSGCGMGCGGDTEPPVRGSCGCGGAAAVQCLGGAIPRSTLRQARDGSKKATALRRAVRRCKAISMRWTDGCSVSARLQVPGRCMQGMLRRQARRPGGG